MLHHHLGGVPDRGRPHRLPLARLPRGGGALPAGTGRPWPGRRRTCPTCCAPARRSTGSARQRGGRARRRRAAPGRGRCPTSGGSCPTSRATGARSLAAWSACSLTTALSVASPWVLRHAIDDLTLGVTRAEALALRRADPGAGRAGGRLPLPDAHGPHRHQPRDRVRAAQRPLRAPDAARPRATTSATASATS